MEMQSNNSKIQIKIFKINLLKNEENSIVTNQNLYNFGRLQSLEEINSNISPIYFNDASIEGIKLNTLDLPYLDSIKNLSDIISKDTSNSLKNKELLKEKKEINKNGEKNKNSSDNLIRRAKKILFEAMMKYDNFIISKCYNNNIGNGLNIKKLLKINHFQIKNTNTIFNKDLLKKSQEKIFSVKISARHTNYPLEHNEILINKLLKEPNEEKRKIFNNLFKKTFKECIQHLTGKKIEGLNGLEYFYKNELLELDEDENFKLELENDIYNFKKIFNNKKPRKRKPKK